MQNDQSESGSNIRRRDAARSRLQETSSRDKQEGVPRRTSYIRSLGRRRSGYGDHAMSPGSGEPTDPSSQPAPALEYYRQSDEECVSGEDMDADEIMVVEEDEADAPAEKSNAEFSDISDSEEEIDEQEQEDMDDSLQQQQQLQQQQLDISGGSSSTSCKSKRPAGSLYGSRASPGNTKQRLPTKQKQQHHHQGQLGSAASGSRGQQSRNKRPPRHEQQDLELQEEQEQELMEQEQIDCSSEQYAADIRRMRESKLKHNKNEQMRRKDMKEAVHRLRNQLRRKTKKPSTISVLKAAKQEIDELTAIKVEEEKELERLRQRELFLKYQLESLVSEHNQRLSSTGNAALTVSPVHAGMTNPPLPGPLHPSLPPSLHSRPLVLPQGQFSSRLFQPAVLPPPTVPHSSSAATAAAAVSSPTAVGRLGPGLQIADHPQHVASHGSSSGISPIRLPIPLPQPPTLIPTNFSNSPSTPPSAGGGGGGGRRGSSTPPTAAAALTPGATISIFPAAHPPGSTTVIPGLTPLHLLPPRTTTNPAAIHGQPSSLFTGFPASPILLPYPAGIAGRHLSPTTPAHAMVGQGLTAAGHPAAIGRLAIAPPTFPFYLPTAAATLRPPTAAAGAIGVPGFGHYGASVSTSQQPGNTRYVQLLASAESPGTVHTTSRDHSRRSSGENRNVRTADDSESHHIITSHSSSTGSKNGIVSAETCTPHTTRSLHSKAINSASVREVSAESRYYVPGSSDDSSGVCRVTAIDSRESEEEYRLRTAKRSRNNDSDIDNDDDDNDSYLRSRTTTTTSAEKRQKVFNRYNRNGVVSGEKNVSKKHLLSAAPPLLKMIDLETAESDQSCDNNDTSRDEKWSQDRQQFVREPADRRRYQHHQCTLPPPPALRNTEVISTVIKHIQPQREVVSSSVVTAGVPGYNKQFEFGNGVEELRYRGGGGGAGEQRYRMSNSLSSSDEGPDSPLSQQKFNSGSEQSVCSCNKKIGRDGVYVQVASHCKHSSSSSSAEISHKNSQYRSLRKKKTNGYLHSRPAGHVYHSIVLQTTT